MSGRLFTTPGTLRRLGVIGLNERNGRFILPENRRKFYERVDSKLATKKLALAGEIPTPALLAILREPSDTRRLWSEIDSERGFVIKPNRGSGGKGVIVVTGREEENFVKGSGAVMPQEEMQWQVSNILGGLYSLGGRRDFALVEERVSTHPKLAALSYQGAPDVRIIVYRGYPVMAMLRVATKKSDGKANLHQGALGLGVDLASGEICHGYSGRQAVSVHPDTGSEILGREVPFWKEALPLAVKAAALTDLGYVGVDLMVDEEKGPLMIEMNARPGLTIQMANGAGLLPRLETVLSREKSVGEESPEEKINFAQETFVVS